MVTLEVFYVYIYCIAHILLTVSAKDLGGGHEKAAEIIS